MIISHAPSPSPDIFYSTPLPSQPTGPVLSDPSSSSPPQPLPIQNEQLKPADYVYYSRRPDDLSSDARARATAAKMKLEAHYKASLETTIELNVQCVTPPSPPHPPPVFLSFLRDIRSTC